MGSNDCRIIGTIKIKKEVSDEQIRQVLQDYLESQMLDFDELIELGEIEIDGSLSFHLSVCGEGGYRNDPLDALVEKLASVVDGHGHIEFFDYDTGDSDASCTPYFIAADETGLKQAQLKYGIDLMADFVRPIIGSQSFDAITRQILGSALPGKT